MDEITIEDQIVSDFRDYFRLTDLILAERAGGEENTSQISEADYLTLLGLVMNHTHWVIETFPEADEQIEEMKVT